VWQAINGSSFCITQNTDNNNNKKENAISIGNLSTESSFCITQNTDNNNNNNNKENGIFIVV